MRTLLVAAGPRFTFVNALRNAALAFLVLAFAATDAKADDWPGATVKTVVSRNGGMLVRMTPGESIGDTYGFASAPKGKYASAQWFRFRGDRYEPYQKVQLVNPVSPIHLAVADDGTLVTLDNWHNVGFGDVVAIYAPDGKLRKRYRLADLYSAADIEKIKRSVSSIWWRCLRDDPHIEADDTLQVPDSFGGRFTFHLGSGTHAYKANGPPAC
jgi:hypothetical protein